MAIDFSPLQQIDPVGGFFRGQEAARAEQERNMLLQQRQMQFEQEQENRLRAQQQDAQFEQMANLIREHGADPEDPQVLGKFAQAAFLSKQPQLASFVATMMERAAKRREPEKPVVVGGRLVRPSTGEVVYEGPEAAPKPLVIGNRLVSPAGEVIYEPPEAPPRPIALGNRLVTPTGEVVYEAPETPARPIAIGNRLVSPTGEVVYEAPPPPSPTPRPIAVGGRLVSPEGQVIYEPPPAPAAAERPVVVGGRLVSPTGQVIYEPPPGTMTPSERFVPVGPNVFNRETGQFLPGPVREPALRQTPETRVKPAAPIRVRPGEVVISPETGQPIFTAPPAPARAAAERGAAPAEGPGVKPSRPMTEAEIAKRRDLVGKEFRNAATALQNLEDTLDSAYQVRTAPGLSRASGFTGTMLPSFPGGAAAQAETRLDNLRGKITAMGKATAAMTGAIGSIANQEWKILADQIAVIDPKKGVQPLTEQLDALERQAEAAMERIRNGYSRIYGEDFSRFPQLRDLPAPKSVRPRAATSGAAPAGNTVTLPDGRVMNFPDAAAAAAFKKAAGL